MSPWVDGKWTAPTAEARAEEGLSVLQPGQTGFQPSAAPQPTTPTTGFAQQPTQPPTQPTQQLDASGQPISFDPSIGQQPQQPQQQSVWGNVTQPWEQLWGNIKEVFGGAATLGGRVPNYTIPAAFAVGTGIGFVASLLGFGVGTTSTGAISFETAKQLGYYKAPSAVVTTATGIAANPATRGALIKYGVGIGLPIVAAVYIADKFLGSWSLAGFQESEAGDPLAIAKYMAVKGKHWDIVDEISAFESKLYGDEYVLDPATGELVLQEKEKGWLQKFTDYMPWVNVRKESLKKIRAQRETRRVMDMIAKVEREMEETGEDEYSIYIKNKEASEKRITDYFNAQRLIAENAILAARKEHNEEEREAWRAYNEELRRQEKIAREEQAAFWLEYLKQKQKLLENYGRSHLGFGLLK